MKYNNNDKNVHIKFNYIRNLYDNEQFGKTFLRPSVGFNALKEHNILNYLVESNNEKDSQTGINFFFAKYQKRKWT